MNRRQFLLGPLALAIAPESLPTGPIYRVGTYVTPPEYSQKLEWMDELVEQAMLRGTIDSAYRRQHGILMGIE